MRSSSLSYGKRYLGLGVLAATVFFVFFLVVPEDGFRLAGAMLVVDKAQ